MPRRLRRQGRHRLESPNSDGSKGGVVWVAMTDKPLPKDDPGVLKPVDPAHKRHKHPTPEPAPDAREPDPNNPEAGEGRDSR